MSADKWGDCPKCISAVVGQREKEKNRIDKLYGKVSMSEWLEEKKKFDSTSFKSENTLREDYECYMSPEGEFTVSYTCKCSSCGFVHNFSHAEKI